MFDALSHRLQDVFQSLKGETRLTETTVENALREIRLALLEADVNFKVVKAFVDRVRDRAMDVEVQKGLNPSQQVIKIVRDELLGLFGELLRGQGVATIFITHDPRAAKQLADRIAVLEAGRIVQTGPWPELAADPRSDFIRRFCSSVH